MCAYRSSSISRGHHPVNPYSVGLSDANVSLPRRKLHELVTKLYQAGVQLELDLPLIAVIGSQSVGKSSLIEAISGIDLPRSAGTCTRCPIECRLASADVWECTVSLRLTDPRHNSSGVIREIPFGKPIHDKIFVEDRIRRAQLAILNPSTNPTHFLNSEHWLQDHADPRTWQYRYTSSCICLSVKGPGLSELMFVDLPGLISTTDDGGDATDISEIRDMISKYISRPNCLILLTIACETDYLNQGAHQIAKTHDPTGSRTIGVLTKPDRIPRGDEDRWVRLIRNESHPLVHGWHCVKNPDSVELYHQLGWEEARARGEEFFTRSEPWSSVPAAMKERLGTTKLVKRLSELLYESIRRRLPELRQEVARLLQLTETRIHELPSPPRAKVPSGELLHSITELVHDISSHIRGSSRSMAIMSRVRKACDEFKALIQKTAPEFRIYEKGLYRNSTASLGPPMSAQDNWDMRQISQSPLIYHVDEVMERRRASLTWELPDGLPSSVSKELIGEAVAFWHAPSIELVNTTEVILSEGLKHLVDVHFGRYKQPGLQASILTTITHRLHACKERSLDHLNWLLAIEEEPYTANNHDFTEYKERFYQVYKATRRQGPNKSPTSHPDLLALVETSGIRTSPNSPVDGPLILGGHENHRALQQLDLISYKDPCDPAIRIMADVRAYYQVAHKRFIDNVAACINHDLLRGLDKDLRLALHEGMRSYEDEFSSAAVHESPEVAAQREELENRKRRLEQVLRELNEL